MKHFKFVLLLAAFSSLGLHCKDEEDNNKAKLPPITMEGKQTFGCLMNGFVFTLPYRNISVDYYNGVYHVGADAPPPPYPDGGFLGFNLDKVIFKTQFYSICMKKTSGSDTHFGCLASGKTYDSDYSSEKDTAYFQILRFDTINFYIAGTFRFTLYNSINRDDSICITDGRFDFKYH